MKTKFLVLGLSYAVMMIFTLMYLLLYMRTPTLGFDPLAIGAIIFAGVAIPYGLFDNMESKKVYDAERRVSDFLRDVAEYTTFGMPISEAIVKCGNMDYGSLSVEVNRVAALISWGVPVEVAMSDFGYHFNSQNLISAGKIIVRAAESGSNISDVMSMVSEFTSQMQLLRNSKFAEMQNYTAVMMIAFGVFLFVILTLNAEFLPQLGASHVSSSGLTIFNGASVSTIREVFNIGMVVQGAGAGVLSGILKDGRIASGFFLAGILVLVSLVMLAIMAVI